MATWNNLVRGNVIAIKTHCGWDPTKIVDEFNPMPTEYDRASGKEGNKAGLGSLGNSPVTFPNDQDQMSVPGMDPYTPPSTSRHSNPNPGKGRGV